MLTWLLAVVFALFLLAAALYFLAPGVVFRAAMAAARRSAGLELKSVTVDGHTVPYLVGGEGEPLVVLHGFGANKDHWTMVARYLTRHFRVIAPDLPGFGDSTRRPEANYGLDAQIARLGAFADALGLEAFHLGGNSMGGYLAAVFAGRHPARVSSLWLLAPAGALTAEPSELQAVMERGENPLLLANEADFDRMTAMCFSTQPPMPAQFKRPLLARAIAESSFNEKIFAELFAEPAGLETEVEGCPTRALIVWGDEDRLLHHSGADVVHALLPNSECCIMKRMGHIPMVERPAETAADWLRFHGRAA